MALAKNRRQSKADLRKQSKQLRRIDSTGLSALEVKDLDFLSGVLPGIVLLELGRIFGRAGYPAKFNIRSDTGYCDYLTAIRQLNLLYLTTKSQTDKNILF